jgi:pyruvate formate lyase activating enzyme
MPYIASYNLDKCKDCGTCREIDELVEAGMTDVGIDLKGMELSTFQRITGLKDRALAQTYLQNAWTAVSYLRDQYKDRIFLGVGIPYNSSLISLELETIMSCPSMH